MSLSARLCCPTSENAVMANFAEIVKAEVQLLRILFPRTPVNKGKKRRVGAN
jgi:hypothetical protein